MKVHIKVFTSDLKDSETYVFPCTAKTRDDKVQRFVHEVKMRFPGNDLRVIHIGKDRVNVFPQPADNA